MHMKFGSSDFPVGENCTFLASDLPIRFRLRLESAPTNAFRPVPLWRQRMHGMARGEKWCAAVPLPTEKSDEPNLEIYGKSIHSAPI